MSTTTAIFTSQAGTAEGGSPSYQAYRILHLGFTVAPLLAGIDKFFHLLCNWDQYLAPWIAGLSPVGGHSLMLAAGVIEAVIPYVVPGEAAVFYPGERDKSYWPVEEHRMPVRDARANSGMSRPVGSKVNQSGQPVTATGVVGETPKLLSRHRKAPRRGMLCQPTCPRPRRKSAV